MRISDWSSDVCSSDLGFEHPLLVGRRNADASVAHRQLQAIRGPLDLDGDLAARFGELHRVGQKVQQDLLDGALVGVKQGAAGRQVARQSKHSRTQIAFDNGGGALRQAGKYEGTFVSWSFPGT